MSDRLLSLLDYALNDAASDAELANAGVRALAEAKKRGACNAATLGALLASSARAEVRVVYRVPPESMVMPFGKFAGQTLGTVFSRDPGYVRWFVDNVKRADPAFVAAARELLSGRAAK